MKSLPWPTRKHPSGIRAEEAARLENRRSYPNNSIAARLSPSRVIGHLSGFLHLGKTSQPMGPSQMPTAAARAGNIAPEVSEFEVDRSRWKSIRKRVS